MEENNNEEKVSLNFKVTRILVEDLPFELMLNLSLVDDVHKNEYDMIWTTTIQSFQNDENGLPLEEEREKLLHIFREAIQKVLKKSDIKIVGTTLHKGKYDIMFYSRKGDMKTVGGAVVELPEYLEDQDGRFLNFTGNPDPEWEIYQTYLKAFE